MHDFFIALSFILIVLSPCLIAARTGFHMESQPDSPDFPGHSVPESVH